MPKETRIPSLSSDRPTASPYPSTAETAARKNMLKKLVRSVYNKKSMEEAKCLICMEPPHNAVILNCSNLEKGCRPYMCGTSNRLSNCLNHFLKSPSSTPTPSCPLCRGKVNKWVIIASFREFMNSIPRSCSVETCEFMGNYPELENHAKHEHPSVRPSVVDPVRVQDWRRLQHERDLEDRNLIAFGSDFESVVPANVEWDAFTALLEAFMVDLPQHQVASLELRQEELKIVMLKSSSQMSQIYSVKVSEEEANISVLLEKKRKKMGITGSELFASVMFGVAIFKLHPCCFGVAFCSAVFHAFVGQSAESADQMLLLQVSSQHDKKLLAGGFEFPLISPHEVAAHTAVELEVANGADLTGSVSDTVSKGSEVVVLLNRTPFYAESGGQIGNVFVHTGTAKEGGIEVGREVEAAVVARLRQHAKVVAYTISSLLFLQFMSNFIHCGFCLLQAALEKVIGKEASQAASLVAFDCLFVFDLISTSTDHFCIMSSWRLKN
ncbi:hypothetical protein RHSIM_Rhsim10G0196700 [Rhododendron simsii]|uniref:Uncharacterized protein n=1 Tax=Rhododendron simsii TaxID=118357 RepID=A0A834GA47_RHOSS|nr:hypothetical protein RHSIM_Rhsim10G0196700 [Rhododendron simsii]